jgi:hypothetical protein
LTTIGWREWVSLPGLGVPTIKAKIDTGARTSSLHAAAIERIGDADHDRVRFWLHPLQESTDVELVCEADVVDRRTVTNSGGQREERVVIRTPLVLGGEEWPIEITLTNRESMTFRMLLGRTALSGRALIEPGRSYLTGIRHRGVYPQPGPPLSLEGL